MTRTRLTRLTALAAALVLPLGLVACGDDDDSARTTGGGSAQEETTTTAAGDGDGSSTTTTTTAGDGGEATTTEGEDGPDGGGAGEDPPASPDLAAALLAVDDLPAGFTWDGEDDTTIDMGDEAGLCDGSPDAPPSPVEQIERTFQSGDGQAFVGSFAGRFEGDDASTLLQWFRDETDRCAADIPEDEGQFSIEVLPGVGDEALILTGTDPSGSSDVAVARVGDVLVGVSSFASPGASVDVRSLLALSVGRL